MGAAEIWELGQRQQPAQRVAEEVERREEQCLALEEDRREDAADQAQIVVRRQPEGHALAGQGEVGLVGRAAVAQVAVAHHHSLRLAGGAGGVLQEGGSVRVAAGDLLVLEVIWLMLLLLLEVVGGQEGQAQRQGVADRVEVLAGHPDQTGHRSPGHGDAGGGLHSF